MAGSSAGSGGTAGGSAEGDAAVHGDGGAVADAAVPDACASEDCQAQRECDADRPCQTADTVCITHACIPDPAAPSADWLRSSWSGRAGRVGGDDRTLWCTPAVTQAGNDGPATVTSAFQLVSLDGTREEDETADDAAQRVRFQCFADASRSGPSTLVTSGWSEDAQGDLASARCPESRPHAAFARCQIAAASKPPYVYSGTACGNGVTGLAARAELHGQLLGDHYELPGPVKPLFNDTGANGAVVGTDLGYQFLAQGRMYIGFGDTWENDWTAPGPLAGFRGSVLFHTRDFDPGDGNGIAFEGWDAMPTRPQVAREIIPSPHDQTGTTEFTAIATAGFGLTENGVGYRIVWFAAIKTWSPFTTNESTLAWSEDGGPFTRGDRAPEFHPPRWPFESLFGPGAIWVDREQGYVYFFGVRTYQREMPVRVARVRATLAAVRDHLQYEYWTGSGWERPDPDDEYALARLAEPAADLIPGSSMQSTRPELSVAYNAHAGRYTMLVQDDRDGFTNDSQSYFQLWQAQAPEGPWSLVDTGDDLTLANTLYGPYMSEQTMLGGGSEVYFLLSDWNLLPLAAGQPYVVGLWSMRLERDVLPGCDP